MKNKLKQVKKYLSDKYYILEIEIINRISLLHEGWIYNGDKIRIFILWDKDKATIYLEDVENKFDVFKIKNILKGSGVILMIDNERVYYE